MLHESELVTSAQNGNTIAFRDLVITYQKKIYYLAYDLTGNHQDAEDLSQDVFILMHQSLDTFRGEAAISTWLYRMTVNTWINNKRRKNAKLKSLFDFFPDGEQDPRDINPPTQPDAHTERSLLYDHIQKAMQKLSDRERSVFTLRQLHDKKIQDIADILDIRIGTVKSLLHRSLLKMQKELAFYHPQYQEAQ